MSEIPKISSQQDAVYITSEKDIPPPAVKSATQTQTDQAQKIKELKEETEALINEYIQKLETLPPANRSGMNRIIELLIAMVPILQDLVMSVSGAMTVPTRLGAVYTELIAKAPFYGVGSGYTNKDGKWVEYTLDEREQLNAKTATYTDTLRAYRDLETDDTKKLQSSVNTINEAVNQAIDILNSMFQQIRELASLLTR